MNPGKLSSYFEEFENGELIYHDTSKTIFENDNNLFSLLTLNHHPVHTNLDFASKEQHGKILTIGTLVFSMASGITVPDISGKAITNLGYEEVKHLAPVFINDTIYCRTKILECTPSNSKSDRGIIYVETFACNQHHEDVLSFKRKVLVKRKPI